MSSLYQALGGSQPSAEQQPSALPPAGPPAVGGGSPPMPMLAALQGQMPQHGSTAELPMGPMVADASPSPTPGQQTVPINQNKMKNLMKGFNGVR